MTAVAAGTDLEQLLATERRLEDRLAAARTEAARLVAEAEAAAAACDAALEADLVAAAAALDTRLDAERRAREARIAAAAERDAARYDGVPQERIEALVQLVVARVLEAGR